MQHAKRSAMRANALMSGKMRPSELLKTRNYRASEHRPCWTCASVTHDGAKLLVALTKRCAMLRGDLLRAKGKGRRDEFNTFEKLMNGWSPASKNIQGCDEFR
jgi:hypothetical protein